MRPKTAELSELRAAADRLAAALADVNEEELVALFKELRRRGKGTVLWDDRSRCEYPHSRRTAWRVRELIDTYAAQAVVSSHRT